jgi:hypothetical protein
MSKELSNIPQLGKDNYLDWARKISAYFRLNNLFNIIAEKEVRSPDDATAQADWDKREMQAAGAIEMTLDADNATHIHGLEGKAVTMWKRLESVHNSRTPGGRFNAMDAFFSIKKEDSEDLRSLITRVKAGMQTIKALRPVPTTTVSSPSSSTHYTLETLDEELVIMALLRALPEDYSSLRSSLFIQSTLNLQIVESAFLAEDNQRQHTTRDNAAAAAALRAVSDRKSHYSQHPSSSRSETSSASSPSTSAAATHRRGKSGITCYFCKNIGHTERECKIKKKAQQNYLQARTTNNANAASDANPGAETESNNEFAGNTSTIPIPHEAHSNLNADTGATRIMMGDENFFSTLRPLVRTIRLANGAHIQSKGEGNVIFQPWVNGSFSPNLITFPNVLFAPDLQSNLVSVLSLVRRQNYEVRINSKQMEFYHGGVLYMTACINSNCVTVAENRQDKKS